MDTDEDRRQVPTRRGDEVVIDTGTLAWRIEQLEDAVKNLEGRGVTLPIIEALDRRYMPRAEMSSEYVPRREHAANRDWTVRILGAVIAIGALLEPVVLSLLVNHH